MPDIRPGTGSIIGYLTHDIYDKFGRLLLVEGTPLTSEIISKLDDRKICFRRTKTPLGLNAKSVAGTLPLSNSIFTVPKQLDKKFERLDMVQVGNASNYLSCILQTMKKDYFFNNHIKVLSQDHRGTYSHSINVGILSVAIAREMDFGKKSLRELTIAALLHDIGKIFLPPITSTDDDWQECCYRQHPRLGADLLAAEKLSSDICLTVKQHHERYSGGGYPDGIKENEIHINSYVVSVADIFDSLTTSSYSENALSVDEAIERILLNKGVDFHPQVVEAFVDLFK